MKAELEQLLFIGKPGPNTPLLAAFGNAEIVGLKWLSLRTERASWAGACDSNEVAILSADGGQVSSVNRARPTKKIPRLLAAGSFIFARRFSWFGGLASSSRRKILCQMSPTQLIEERLVNQP